MKLYAKGKRGIIYRDDNICIKEKNPDAAVDTLMNEAKFLQVLNEKNIGPKFIKFENGKLFRDFVEGERIEEFLQSADKENIIKVLKNVLEQCRAMDERGVEKKEMTKPYKDILITKDNKPVLIDFERCRFTEHPGNVTQFLQYIAMNKEVLEKKGICVDKKELIKLGKEYKENPCKESFERILKII
ncbi:MAG: hypothetical protein KKF46_04765 [Nanoarchaeota archaeon]|nr:hypothetical protein [Nanoarchaeota archaeon]MBU1321645.1 hypothetical protein [Nanoarchaeota archaeon]MBU1597147.1 hypothetical protein [Nanoarchaeota archaeon]MBU2442080.1 hypothetical protein [Nanoarchaeota archaeon]